MYLSYVVNLKYKIRLKNITRKDLHVIARYSNLNEELATTILEDNVYNDKVAWQKFLRWFIMSIGIGFTVAGILFFFAYNWADLHKFVKIGLIEGLLIITVLALLFFKLDEIIKNIILFGASVLVGVLFAVFGQIYQTGANAYDFFLGWTVFISLWVFISGFTPLWLFYLVLINTTFILYSEQVANNWSFVFVLTLLFLFNVIIFISTIYLGKKNIPKWFLNIIGLGAVCYATTGLIDGVFEDYPTDFYVLLVFVLAAYGTGIGYGLRVRESFFLSVIPFSVVVVSAVWFISLSTEFMMFFVVTFLIIISVTLIIKNVIDLKKRWANEE